MKALVYTGPECVLMMDMPSPTIAPGEVLLKIHASGICGSDIHGYLGHSERRKPGLILGHEGLFQEHTGLRPRVSHVVGPQRLRCGIPV